MAGGMRRPPRLWEQKLEQMIRGVSRGATAASTGNADQGLAPGPGGANDDPGENTPVVDPDPTTPRLPATPSVAAAIGGLSILWTGLDADGDPFPAGTTVQVHVSTSTGFTPDGTTLRGTIPAGERIVVTGLTSGTTYYVRFVLVAPDGTEGETSAETSTAAGFVLSTNIGTGEITADLVSFDASAIGGIQQFVGNTTPAVTGAGTPAQQPKDGSTWINTSNNSYYTLTSGSWVQRQWGSAAISAGAISTTQLAAGAITVGSAIIANGAIGNAQIANAAITDAKVQSLDATKITTGFLSADRIQAGSIALNKLVVTPLTSTDVGSGGSTVIDGGRITSGTITGRTISGGTVTGATLQSATSGNRIVITANGNTISFISTAGTATIASVSSGGSAGVEVTGFLEVSTAVNANSLKIDSGFVDMLGVYNNNTTGIDEVGIQAVNGRLRRISSSQTIKYDMATLSGTLSESVDADRQLGVATVNADDVLNLAVTEFSVIDDGEPTDRRVLGFIADDVADKFPIAATRDADGNPAGVLDTAILAGLLAVVKQQQQTIDNLTARLDALEAN